MKRYMVSAIILICITATCLGENKSRSSQIKIIQLPEPQLTGAISLEQAIAKRRSAREFTSQPLNFAQIGQLAWAGQGITEKQNGFRTAPSAGDIYPIKLYFATPEGLFIYHPKEHSLREISRMDIREKLATAALNQEAVASAGCDIIVAGSVRDLMPKYGNKSERYMLLEAGHTAQNILLQAVCLELASVPVSVFDIRELSKVCNLTPNLEPLYILCLGYPSAQKPNETKVGMTDAKKTKKAVLIIASENFRDEELFETKDVITKAGTATVIASTRTGVIKGILGGKAEATILVSDIVVDDYDAIIFIGGLGAKEYFENKAALNIAQQTVEKKKVLAAICIAPTVLANAGVLDGVRATSFPSERVKLKKAGAQYTGAEVEWDGLIITADGPKSAGKFGNAIANALASK